MVYVKWEYSWLVNKLHWIIKKEQFKGNVTLRITERTQPLGRSKDLKRRGEYGEQMHLCCCIIWAFLKKGTFCVGLLCQGQLNAHIECMVSWPLYLEMYRVSRNCIDTDAFEWFLCQLLPYLQVTCSNVLANTHKRDRWRGARRDPDSYAKEVTWHTWLLDSSKGAAIDQNLT